MYLQYSHPLIYRLLPNVLKASYTISASIFLDVSCWSLHGTDKFISCVVPVPLQWNFHFGGEIVIAWTQEKTTTLVVQNPIILHDNARSHTAAVTDLLRRWQWEILEYPLYSPDMSSCDYNLFVRMKEPLWGTRYNTRDVFHAIRQSVLNIKKDGCTVVYDAFQTFGKRW